MPFHAELAVLFAGKEKEGTLEYKKMKCSVRSVMLAVLALSCFCGYRAYAGARPVIGGIPSSSFFNAKTAVGSDGLLRLIFDYNPANLSTSASTYSGSALWIIDPNGSVVAAGSPTIPASIGSDVFEVAVINNIFTFLTERSNTAIFAQADGNTTVLFYYNAASAGLGNTNSFGVWTYNSSGSLIAAASYGPFSGTTRLGGLYFDTNGKIVARWKAGPSVGSATAGWVLDEFGSIANSTAFFGGFGLTFLGQIRVNSSNQQIWPFLLHNADGTYTTTIWTFDSSGSLVNSQVYGPF
jgi:hypothetical protein